MVCQICKAVLCAEEGRYIVYKSKKICVCERCFDMIRRENIDDWVEENRRKNY